MGDPEQILNAEDRFFAALLHADAAALEAILAGTFSLVDLTGGQMSKTALIESVAAGRLKFDAIDRIEQSVQVYQGAGVVTGRTLMRVQANDAALEIPSRYTHTYVKQGSDWRLAAAQGTPIQAP